jgi:hypothetical protein
MLVEVDNLDDRVAGYCPVVYDSNLAIVGVLK